MTITIKGACCAPSWVSTQQLLISMLGEGRLVAINRKDRGVSYIDVGEYNLTFLTSTHQSIDITLTVE